MAHQGFKDSCAAYYPPRARWYSRWLSRISRPVRRRVDVERMRLPGGLTPFGLVLGVLVPGCALFASGRRLWGWGFVGLFAGALIVFVTELGYPAGSIAYGLVISLHASSIIYVEGYWLKEASLFARLGCASCTSLAVWGLLYAPGLNFVERHWLVPLRVGEEVLVIRRGINPERLRRGDWVAYRIQESSGWRREAPARVYLQSGLSVGPVIGLPGDRIQFTRKVVLANGRPSPLGPSMPQDGELVVPEKVWFIWPNLSINRRGGVPEASITALLQETAMVQPEQMIGRPFKYWFWRPQRP